MRYAVTPAAVVLAAGLAACEHPTAAPVADPLHQVTPSLPLLGTSTTLPFLPTGNPPHSLSGNRLVWWERVKVKMFDVVSFEETVVWEDPTSTSVANGDPWISGDRIAYADPEEEHVYVIDLRDDSRTRVSGDDAVRPSVPVIEGDVVAWLDDRFEGWRSVYGYDLASGTPAEFPVAINSHRSDRVAVSNRRIVWVDSRVNLGDVMMYDVDTGEQTPVWTLPDAGCLDSGLDFDWPWVVRADCRQRRPDGLPQLHVFLKNVVTGEEIQVTDETSGIPKRPRISGNIVVWEDLELTPATALDFEIFYYNIETRKRGFVTRDNLSSFPVDIDGLNMVYTEGENERAKYKLFEILDGLAW